MTAGFLKEQEMMEYGLIGAKLGHSFSKDIHSKIGKYDYQLIELTDRQLDEFLKEKNFKAVNVTIPYKQTVIPYLDHMTQAASDIGAVNCIRNDNGRLIGHNTDFDGLSALIRHARVDLEGKKVLILGTGGTSDTASAVCKSFKAAGAVKVSRRKTNGAVTYEEAYSRHKDAQIIINTTPCGMYPDIFAKPIDIDGFDGLEGVIDVIYNPLRSLLITDAKAKNIKAEGGLYMLVAQAVSASEFFMDTEYGRELTEDIYDAMLKDKANIVLTGMPASGKSTIGKAVAKKLKRDFYDIDSMVEEQAGMTISDMFEKYGERYFRDRERTVAAQLASKSGAVIATGGGTVIEEENARRLKMNGILLFLDRDPKLLRPTADRPTAFDREQMMKRYDERYDIYRDRADFIIKNDGAEKTAIDEILKEFQ